MTELPNPPIPTDVDLRDFSFTPIFRARLFGSAFHARSNDAEWRAGVTLWLKSWDQVPAGSLPENDVDLCRLAEFGRDLKGWRRVRDGALHGWFKCSDGRLYHLVVAEGVLEAHERRRTASTKGKAGARKRWSTGNATANTPANTPANATANTPANATAIAGAMPGDSNRQGQGQGQGQEDPERAEPAIDSNGHDPNPSPPDPPDPRKRLFDLGKSILGANAGGLINKALASIGESRVGAILGEMALSTKSDPRAYFTAAVGGKNSGGASERQVIP